ncbi:MAG: CHRD domain-containing protein [Gemmatimonadetes bacterium]|nr:CHRD domain-containing protein [Gemmatimonadota bacterium]
MRVWRSSLAAVVLLSACAEGGPAPTDVETVVVPVFTHAPGHDAKNFRTHLTGDEEVPANASLAEGQAIFQLQSDGTLDYRLIVANIENVTQAHIHLAPAGTNGGIVVWLYPSAPPAVLIPGRSDGNLAQGTITDSDVVGALTGQGVAGLLPLLQSAGAYVNVHTSQIPGGEIRGQID